MAAPLPDEPDAWLAPIHELDAERFQSRLHLLPGRLVAANRIRPARFHVPNRVDADVRKLGKSFLIKLSERPSSLEVVASQNHRMFQLWVLHTN
jgi:hypothetical protein